MKVVDKTNGRQAEKREEEIGFMLTSKSGSFCLMSNSPKSRYEGVFFREGKKIFKVIENLEIALPVKKLVNNLWMVSRERQNGEKKITESFFMPLGLNSLVYELSEKAELDLILDCKQINDSREWGRSYSITKKKGYILIKFSKKDTEKEEKGEMYDIFFVVYSNDLEFKPAEKWKRRFYSLDHERRSAPFERYVFNACRLRLKDAVFSFGADEKKAVAEAKYVWSRREKLKKEKEAHVSSLIHRKSIDDNETAVAYQCSLNALDSLVVNEEGISAGLPWFFQFWARDELISLKAVMLMGNYSLAKKIIFKYLNMIGHDGMLPEKDIDPKIGSADATLWLFKRLDDFIEILNEKKIRRKYIGFMEMKVIKDKLHRIVSQWMRYHMKEGLVINESKQTWMDTEWNFDKRTGARIEIQALFLACLRLLGKIDKEEPLEKELVKNARKAFVKKNIISDGANDKTIRPNVFIAAYAYPELMTKNRWIKCFESMIPKLWEGWGGLSSIGKSNQLYSPTHTGENPRSYHRGDSWFWINNLAALVLYRLDRKKFKKYIGKLLKASINEMLYLGVTGYSAELSSASKLKSEGCMCQAWSSAMFIELIEEIYK